MSIDPVVPLIPPSWENVFGNTNPVEIEIGPGKGSFLLSAAQCTPDRNFFGVEFSRRRAYRIAQLIERDRPENVIVIAADINCILKTLIRPASVATCHLYFPDPWWKRRHHRRRLFRANFTQHLARTLIPGGKILLATDVHDYFVEIVRQLTAVPALVQFPWQRDQTNDDGKLILTDFERQFTDDGKFIYYTGFTKDS